MLTEERFASQPTATYYIALIPVSSIELIIKVSSTLFISLTFYLYDNLHLRLALCLNFHDLTVIMYLF